MKTLIGLSIIFLALTGCESKMRTNSANPYEVTINHGPLKSQDYVYGRAQAYCSQYGRTASFKGKFDSSNSVFECR